MSSLHKILLLGTLFFTALLFDQLSSAYCYLSSALALKGIEYETHPVHLLKDGGQQVRFNLQCTLKNINVTVVLYS